MLSGQQYAGPEDPWAARLPETHNYGSFNVAYKDWKTWHRPYPVVPPREEIWNALRCLDGLWVRTLLLQISDAQARVAWEIWDEWRKRQMIGGPKEHAVEHGVDVYRLRLRGMKYERQRGVTEENVGDSRLTALQAEEHGISGRWEEKEEEVCFDAESRAIWYVLQKEHNTKSAASQKAIAPTVFMEITELIQRVREQAATSSVSFTTRRKALEILRNIGESICHAPGTLGTEIRAGFRNNSSLKSAMVEVLAFMGPQELEKMANINDCCSRFFEKMRGLYELGREFDIFQDLEDVLKLLMGRAKEHQGHVVEVIKEEPMEDADGTLMDIPSPAKDPSDSGVDMSVDSTKSSTTDDYAKHGVPKMASAYLHHSMQPDASGFFVTPSDHRPQPSSFWNPSFNLVKWGPSSNITTTQHSPSSQFNPHASMQETAPLKNGLAEKSLQLLRLGEVIPDVTTNTIQTSSTSRYTVLDTQYATGKRPAPVQQQFQMLGEGSLERAVREAVRISSTTETEPDKQLIAGREIVEQRPNYPYAHPPPPNSFLPNLHRRPHGW